ncbi:unnamed protein product [Microthlaspi erraticum]|uniref:Uncharacterized protein n=1 Tax=Microthlaspi erraticum TaxID=1685480 RepID=A0A6D2HPA7_9BRAS|nr:unnamed protein product [Microthlaspi erraticum]
MASDSQTATAVTSEKPLENKVSEEAKLIEKEIVLPGTADVVKDEPVSDSNLTVTNEDQNPAGEPEKESPAVVEEVAAVVKAEESTEKGKDESGEKVAEPVELKEPTLVKEVVEELNVEAADEKKVAEQVEFKETILVKEIVGEVNVAPVDEEKAEERGEDENGEKKVAEQQVELKEPILVKDVNVEAADTEKPEEKQTVESVVVEEDNKEVVDVSESTDEAGGKPVDVQSVSDVSAETTEVNIRDVEVLEVEPKVETQPEKAKEVAPEVELVKAEEEPETTEEAKVEGAESGSASCPEEIVPTKQDSDTAPKKEAEEDASSQTGVIEKAITEEKHVVDEPSKDEEASESVSALSPEKVVPTSEDSDTNTKKETEGGDISSPADDVIEKAITEEKHVLEDTSKDENASEAKDVVTKLPTEDENIKKDSETPAAEDGKSEETLKETDTESREKEDSENKQEETVTEKVAEVIEAAPVVEGSDETKQQPEVTTKEAPVKPKNSNSIMSKVKQSLVKAKKAIIGKSPSSKTMSSEEAKGEIKVK